MFCLQLGSPSAQVDDVQTGAASGRSAWVKSSGRLPPELWECKPVWIPTGLQSLKIQGVGYTIRIMFQSHLNPSVPGIPKTGRFHFQLKIIRVTDEIIISKLQQIHGALEFFAFERLQVLKSETLGPDWLKRSHRFLKNFNKFVFECNFQAPQIL